MNLALNGVRQKLIRAKVHLDSISGMLGRFAYGECEIVPEKDAQGNLLLRVCLPAVPDSLAPAIGDFLFNVRSALDHIVWQLVLINPPNKPDRRTAFPVCTSPDNYGDAIARHRLDGVPAKASALIETLQPYAGRQNPLARLEDLHNVDKHRQLSLITAVASDVALDWTRGTELICRMNISNHELRDGTILGDMAVNLAGQFVSARLPDVKVQGKAAIFVAFSDVAADDLKPLRVEAVLEEILEFVRNDVYFAFEPFFD